MAATVAVYFHPGRTAGSMYESVFFVALSLLYSFIMVTASMVVSKEFVEDSKRNIGYAIDIVVFIGFGLGVVAFVKQRIGKPTFNTACSVASIFMVTSLTKEGNVQAGIISFEKVMQSFALVCSGVAISLVVSLTLWPKSALEATKKELNESMNLSAKMLKYLTLKFMDYQNMQSSEFNNLKASFNASYQRLGKSLDEAAYELLLFGKEAEYQALEKLTKSSKKLSLLFNGLGSSVLTQSSLLEEDGTPILETPEQEFSSYSSLVDDTAVSQFFGDTSRNPAASIFNQFIKSIRPTMMEYSTLLQELMQALPFSTTAPYNVALETLHTEVLSTVLKKYSSSREQALYNLYKEKSFLNDTDFDSIATKEAEAASCGNFSYILEEIGNGLTEFIKDLAEYQSATKAPRSFNWLRGSKTRRRRVGGSSSIFVDVTRTQLNTEVENKYDAHAQENPGLSLKVWRSLRAFRRPDIQFGIKVGMGAALFALPAFHQKLRPTYQSWRGEWGLITFVIIMNKSVGGTANTVPVRILGTFLGAFIAFSWWTFFPENAVMLCGLGALLSLVCFYIILTWTNKGMFGRFILLTYNLTVLYSYSVSINDDEEHGGQLIVRDIAFHRFVSVCAGVVWALIISTFVLPNSARKKLKRGLSILWLQIGLVWKADALKTTPRKGTTESRFTGIQGENAMQLTMIELNAQLQHAPNELRLKGPFPATEYSQLLRHTQRILDVFQDISVLIAKDPKPSSRELEIIEYTTLERTELCNRIFLNFYLISSAMRLGFPLPNKMPSTEHAIDRMLAKLNEYRAGAIGSGTVAAGFVDPGYVEDFILFYSYVLATIAITEQLAELAVYIQELFGVIEEEMFEV